MKQLIGLFCLLLCVACTNESAVKTALIGKWKIYKTHINQRDISKRSDPTNENGLAFQEDNQYISFGNVGHQDQGIYQLKGQQLILKSEKGKNTAIATFRLQNDSLELDIVLDSLQTLYMKLYKMN